MKNKIYAFLIFSLSFLIGLYSLNNSKVLAKNNLIDKEENFKDYLFEYINSLSSFELINDSNLKDEINIVIKETNKIVDAISLKQEEPIIYLYNTHQKEKYANGSLGVYELNPTVLSASYLIKDMLEENNIKVIVEEKDIIKTMKQKKYNYDQTYLITRDLLKKNIKKYPSLKYFIDIHRDSISKKSSTITINKKPYAKIMFVAGMKNKNNAKNLEFMEALNTKLTKKYKGISRGIYKKNYVYNQDVNPGVILIEIGGQDNTMEEVYNTCNAISKALIEYIGEQNG